jgi:hypothetical protein
VNVIWKTYSESSPFVMNNPNNNFNTREELAEIAKQNEEIADVGFIEGTQNFMEFMGKVGDEGFWRAVYDKPFSEVLGGLLKETAHDVGVFVLGNGDLFFLMPAIFFMVCTFIIGRNKFTKWILPCWFAYFISRVFFRMIL